MMPLIWHHTNKKRDWKEGIVYQKCAVNSGWNRQTLIFRTQKKQLHHKRHMVDANFQPILMEDIIPI